MINPSVGQTFASWAMQATMDRPPADVVWALTTAARGPADGFITALGESLGDGYKARLAHRLLTSALLIDLIEEAGADYQLLAVSRVAEFADATMLLPTVNAALQQPTSRLAPVTPVTPVTWHVPDGQLVLISGDHINRLKMCSPQQVHEARFGPHRRLVADQLRRVLGVIKDAEEVHALLSQQLGTSGRPSLTKEALSLAEDLLERRSPLCVRFYETGGLREAGVLLAVIDLLHQVTASNPLWSQEAKDLRAQLTASPEAAKTMRALMQKAPRT